MTVKYVCLWLWLETVVKDEASAQGQMTELQLYTEMYIK